MTVRDVVGLLSTGSVEVVVTLTASLEASFIYHAGALDTNTHTRRWTFDGSASRGSIVSYTWDLIGKAGFSTSVVTTGPILEIDLGELAQTGTMTLTVTAEDARRRR